VHWTEATHLEVLVLLRLQFSDFSLLPSEQFLQYLQNTYCNSFNSCTCFGTEAWQEAQLNQGLREANNNIPAAGKSFKEIAKSSAFRSF
jgi:hypothetical protein